MIEGVPSAGLAKAGHVGRQEIREIGFPPIAVHPDPDDRPWIVRAKAIRLAENTG